MTNARQTRLWGIGEWYGKLFSQLTPDDRRRFAEIQTLPGHERPLLRCPFQSGSQGEVLCKKEGGVCSLQLFERSAEGFAVPHGNLATTCPNRFQEGGTVYEWISEVLLGGGADVRVLGQVGFLEKQDGSVGDVGRIDNVLVVPGRNPLVWCAVEMQAVYFQGASMSKEFAHIRQYAGPGTPFPVARRQPDFRSSGPKRLMPQLEIKVPTLRRWGKKMAVVVDRNFFDSMGRMESVPHVSNCDIAWFVVRYEPEGESARLVRDEVYLTTLERSVEGLTAGIPVDLETFEQRILERLRRST